MSSNRSDIGTFANGALDLLKQLEISEKPCHNIHLVKQDK